MTYIVEIDAAACAAHGDCVELAPEVFALGEVAEVIGTGPDGLLMEVAKACPSVAIRVLDGQTRACIYP